MEESVPVDAGRWAGDLAAGLRSRAGGTRLLNNKLKKLMPLAFSWMLAYPRLFLPDHLYRAASPQNTSLSAHHSRRKLATVRKFCLMEGCVQMGISHGRLAHGRQARAEVGARRVRGHAC
jgi:hypothetical protein